MRNVCPAALVAVSLFTSSLMMGQGSTTLSITNYQGGDTARVTRTQWSATYSASLVNHGSNLSSCKATVTSLSPFVTVVAGKDVLNFGAVAANGQAVSSNTFTILIDRSVPFDFSSLQWTFQPTAALPPVANAGPNQTAARNATVTLNGSGSTNPSGVGTLSYGWAFTARPAGSTAILLDSTSVMPRFVVDAAGDYVIKLTVSNGMDSGTASVTVSTVNTPPVAKAGADQTATVGSTITLNGSGSSDVDGNPLTYSWTLSTRPAGSAAALTGANSISPTFVVDKPGQYTAQLIVNDGIVNSSVSSVSVSTINSAPVAKAGVDQVVNVGSLVQLNASGSTDVDGDTLTYLWGLTTVPAGSTATLSSSTAVNPTFTADRPGTYVAQLVVNDGKVNSTTSPTVTITTNAVQAPTANAGPNQTVLHGATVTLNGTGTDPQNLPITYQWSLITRPSGSIAGLSSANTASLTFTADRPGVYVAQLIVSNGYQSSAPSNVTITTTNTAPVANAGSNQVRVLGENVVLNGSASSDADHDTLTYTWSFTSRPAGSAATLSGANAASAMFSPDVIGTYVAQLIVNDGIVNSTPVTVSIIVGTKTITLTPNPLNLFNAPDTMSVLLGIPAGAGGQTIILSSSDTTVASLPSSVTIAEGATGANVQVAPGVIGSATITAAAAGFTSGSTAVTVATPTITITVDPATVGIGRNATGTVTLAGPAPASGAVIFMSSNPGGIADVQPDTLTIPGGSTTGTFTVTGLAQGTTTVTGRSAGYIGGSRNVTVSQLGAIQLQSNLKVGPNQTVAMSVTLLTGAPASGVTISLASNNESIVTISPSTVHFAAGATTPDVQPQVTGVNFGTATITASADGFQSDSQQVVVNGTLSFAPGNLTIAAAATQNLTLNLSSPAPASGVTVNLSSDDVNVATVPATVSFAANATSVTVLVTGVSAGNTTIHASSSPSLADTTATITVAVLGSINVPESLSVQAEQSATLQVTLSSPAPAGGVTVALTTSDSAKATVSPASVTIAAGSTTPAAQPQVTGVSAGSAIITAKASGYTQGATNVTVTAKGSISLPANVTVSLGQSAAFAVTLSQAAPTGGVSVTLASSDESKVTISPATVTIAAGATTPATQPQVTGVNLGSANITASSTGYTSATQAVKVTGTVSFTLATATLNGTETKNLTLTLSAAAPAGGVTINLSSSDTAVATVPPTVSFAANATTVSVPVTGVAGGSATIRASALPNIAEATAAITVSTGPGIILPVNVAIAPGDSTPYAISLAAAAPADGIFIDLASSDTSIVNLSSTRIFIPQGSKTPTAAPRIIGGKLGSATITASATGLTGDSQTVRVTATLAFTPNIFSVSGNSTSNLTLTLSAPAPAGGITVTLSSDNTGVATVPQTVTIAANATSVSVPVTGVTPGSTTIRASATNLAETTAAITVTTPGAINLPADLTVGLGQNATFAVILGTPAPTNGVTVTLSSADESKVTISPLTVFIAAGATAPDVQPKVTGVNLGTANIKATAPGYAQSIQAVKVTATASFTPGSLTITGPLSQNLTLTLSANAPATGLTINLSSSNTSAATVPATVDFAPGTNTVTVPVTAVGVGAAVIHASALPGIADTTSNITIASAGAITLAGSSVGLGQNATLTVTLPSPAPAGGVTVTLSSGDIAKVTVNPATITIPAGSTTPASQPTITGVNIGTANISASSPVYTSATQAVQVNTTISFASQSLSITGPVTKNLTLNIAAAAPTSVTIALSSSNKAAATVPDTIVIPANATSVAVPVTGVAQGSTVIHASFLPFIADTTADVTVTNLPTIILPSAASLALGASAQYPVTLSAPAPENITITLASGDTAKVTIAPATITIAAGAVAPQTQPQVSGVNVGATSITATAPLYTTANQAIQVTATVSFSGNLTATGVTSQNLVLTLSAGAPAGQVVNILSTNTSVATVPGTVMFAPNATTVNVPVTTVAAGTAEIHASLTPYIPDTKATVTVNAPAPSGQLTVTGATVGKDLQKLVTVVIPQGAPSGGVRITLTSSDPAKFRIAGHLDDIGTASLTVPIIEGSNQASVYIQALASSGTATLTASAPTYDDGTSTITLSPSGFVVVGPEGMSSSSFNSGQGIKSTLTVLAARLTAALAYAETQPVRGGFTASVTVASSTPSVGTITASPLSFTSGTESLTTQFNAINTGSSSITVSSSGFSLPSQGGTLTANVSALSLSLTQIDNTVGQNLQTEARVELTGAAPAQGLTITVTSNDANKLLLSTSPDGQGSGSLLLTVDAGRSVSQYFYVQALGNTGSVSYKATASGFGEATSSVTMAPSGIILSGPYGLNFTTGSSDFPAVIGQGSTLTAYAVMLDATTHKYVASQPVRGGFSANVEITSSNPSVGVITTSPITIASANYYATTLFVPVSAGQTTLSVGTPSGFTAPASLTTAVATITQRTIGLPDPPAVGQNLQVMGTVLLGDIAPAGGLQVTLTSSNPSQLLLSDSSTNVGSGTITITVPQGANTGTYYLQALGNSGSVTITASVPGYTTRTTSATLASSGLVFAGPFGWDFPIYISASAGAADLTVYTAALDSNGNFSSQYTVQQVRAGYSVSVGFTPSSPSLGTISPNPVTIAGGTDNAVAKFTPAGPGTGSVSLTSPVGLGLSNNHKTLQAILLP